MSVWLGLFQTRRSVGIACTYGPSLHQRSEGRVAGSHFFVPNARVVCGMQRLRM